MEHLLNPANIGTHEREDGGCRYLAPHFPWQEHRIRGATCMILGKLVALLEELEPDG